MSVIYFITAIHVLLTVICFGLSVVCICAWWHDRAWCWFVAIISILPAEVVMVPDCVGWLRIIGLLR